MSSTAPLFNLRVLELAGLAPGPFCGLLLASYGASVLRVDRPSPIAEPTSDNLTAYKSSIALDLKSPLSHQLFISLIVKTDVLIDPFRPGVLEKLQLGPEAVLRKINPRLIVVRLTGFRRDGKYHAMAGHDINYLAVSGVLSLLGAHDQPPSPPANLLADFAGGGLAAFAGVLLALLARSTTNQGQVVEANMVDGASFLATMPRLALQSPLWNQRRGTNVLDGGCPYYGCYECRDAGKYMSVGALEPQFFALLLDGLGLQTQDILADGATDRLDRRCWPHMRTVFTQKFKTKSRAEWEAIFDGVDACVAPVLEMAELQTGGYEQRLLVGLTTTPGRQVRDAWEGRGLRVGQGGEEVLSEWMGWRRGREYDVVSGKGGGVFVWKECTTSRL